MKIVLASRNAKKIEEVKRILSEFSELSQISVFSLDDVGIYGEIEEDGATFEENALIKARVGAINGCIGLADDSGLEVDALGGAPGIYSARYAGEAGGHASDERNNEFLLENLKDVPQDRRTARYVAAIACVFPDGREFTVRGTAEGVIIDDYRGNGGFGYDPIFYFPEFNKTFAELSPEEKNSVSHRGKAMRLFANELKKYLEI
ncbi:MAG: RdgB/HAM1 family non-canonical purine NTP pyrophosphatase [Clostridia bacterium]|nr:RdgB/HAM1 family non-canonical purine NTP pyrophosphatase [Clostridia bacterium]